VLQYLHYLLQKEQIRLHQPCQTVTTCPVDFSSRRVRHPYSRRRQRSRRSGVEGHRVTGSRSAAGSAELRLDASVDELYDADELGDDERLSLRLDRVTTDDAGSYSCRAFNKAGTVNFTYTLRVTGRYDVISRHVTQLGRRRVGRYNCAAAFEGR